MIATHRAHCHAEALAVARASDRTERVSRARAHRLVIALALGFTLATMAGAQNIEQFGVGAGCGPWGITGGPDGNLWLTCGSSNLIQKISPAGSVLATFTLVHPSSYPVGITTGPDGNVWFGEHNGNRIARITTAGIITEFDLPNPGSGIVGVAPGSDGNVWFTEQQGHRVGKITPSGTITEYTDPANPGMTPGLLALGPDGNLWIAEGTNNIIAKVTPAGVFTDYTAPSATSIGGITNGGDGYLWFVEDGADKVARIRASDGHIDEFGPFPGESGFGDIALGADGRIWVDEREHSKILRLHSSGVLQATFTVANDAWNGIAGPDGNVWFINGFADAVTRVDIATGFEDFPFDCTDGTGGGSVVATPDGGVWGVESNVSSDFFGHLGMPTLAIQLRGGFHPGLELFDPGSCMAVDDLGDLWFPDVPGNSIDEIVGFDTFAYPLPTSDAHPMCVALGADGNLWFTEEAGGKVGRVTPAGAVSEFALPAGAQPLGIVLGPDGNVWFADFSNSALGRVTPAATITEFSTAPAGHPVSVAADASRLWFTGSGLYLAAMTVDGAVASTSLSFSPGSVTTDGRGGVWVASLTPSGLFDFSPATGALTFHAENWPLLAQISATSASGVWYGSAKGQNSGFPFCDSDHPGLFGHLRFELFVDGFESGNTWRWSTHSF